MAKYSRLKVLNSMIEVGVVPVFYHPDPDVTVNVIEACLNGGARCFEFTNRGDRAFEVFSEVAKRLNDDPRLILGAGTIMNAPVAALYLQLGANFVVGPNLNPEVARLCNAHKVAYSPGCGTVSEISQAEELGVEICKVFPGQAVGGPGFIKNVLGPMPWSRLMPTGGVNATEESVHSWISAGAACVGMGSSLFRKDILESKDYSAITEQMAAIIAWIKNARGGKEPIS
jgi:2-dehydro-3-deoxyphosphogluconate aldolase/(4S)-4-hydroxy-2-oxoglutarate aldolase